MYPLCALWDQRIDFPRMRADRQTRIQEWLAQEDIPGLITFRPENVSYITALRPVWGEYLGYLTKYAVVVARGSPPILFVRDDDLQRCRTGMPWLGSGQVRLLPPLDGPDLRSAVVGSLGGAIQELGLAGGRIAVDAADYGVLESLEQAFPEAEFVDGDYFMKQAKMIKTEDEIGLLRMACAISDIGFRVAQKAIKPGVRECEVLGEIYRAQYAVGAERPQGTHIVASGWRTVPLHRMATDKIISDGDLVFLDIGVSFNTYFSDGTRVYVAGTRPPTPEQRRLHKAVYESLQAMVKLCRPGTLNSELNRVGRGVIEDYGYGKYSFFGLFGHGLGTSAQEAPVIGEAAHKGEVEMALAARMVIALEPGAFVPSVGGIRCEDVILITHGEPEVLTRAPYDERLMD